MLISLYFNFILYFIRSRNEDGIFILQNWLSWHYHILNVKTWKLSWRKFEWQTQWFLIQLLDFQWLNKNSYFQNHTVPQIPKHYLIFFPFPHGEATIQAIWKSYEETLSFYCCYICAESLLHYRAVISSQGSFNSVGSWGTLRVTKIIVWTLQADFKEQDVTMLPNIMPYNIVCRFVYGIWMSCDFTM